MKTSQLEKIVVAALEDIKGKEIEVIDTEKLTPLFERIIIACGDSNRQVKSLARHVADKVREAGGEVLYVEDSRVVAMATRRMLEKHGLSVTHATRVEDAIAHLETARAQGKVPGPDVVLTDVYLKGDLTGHDLLRSIRTDFGYAKGLLPVLVMTGDANPANQSDLLRTGANDLVQKPIEERLLVTKLLFQLRVGRLLRDKLGR